MNKKAAKKAPERVIVTNRKARHDYTIEDTFEAGLVLEGWEVKSLRANRAQLKESYVILKHGEAWLIGAHFSPLANVAAYIKADPVRSRKLLLSHKELNKLQRARERDGYTIVALDLHWTHNRAKAQIALAKGKKQHDKRDAAKRKDWNREKQRIMRR